MELEKVPENVIGSGLNDPIRGGQPARPNLKREKNEKFQKDRRNWE